MLQETLSSMSVSILYSGIQNRTQSSRQGLTSAKQRAKNHFSQLAGYTLASAAQDGVDLQDALLTHIGVFFVYWDTQDFLCGAALEPVGAQPVLLHDQEFALACAELKKVSARFILQLC